MKKYIPTFTDITDWQIIVYANTGGSRRKKIAIEPKSDDEYFFKGSKEKNGEIRYPTEFWSEIISSKIGQFLGFDMLDYNIAYSENDNQKIGCLSKSMIDSSKNKLTEGKSYLTGYNPDYNPETDKTDYTFQFIKSTLSYFKLDNHISKLIAVIIFDAIISNSDRHQENWGFITSFKEKSTKLRSDLKKMDERKLSTWITKFTSRLMETTSKTPIDEIKHNSLKEPILKLEAILMKNDFSPIYDSGCCLGREFTEKQILEKLSNSKAILKYVNGGRAEIYWKGSSNKKTHYELITLLKKEYPTVVNSVIQRVKSKFSEPQIKSLIYSIDANIPEMLSEHKLSENRKELMVKILTLRFEKLFELL